MVSDFLQTGWLDDSKQKTKQNKKALSPGLLTPIQVCVSSLHHDVSQITVSFKHRMDTWIFNEFASF